MIAVQIRQSTSALYDEARGPRDPHAHRYGHEEWVDSPLEEIVLPDAELRKAELRLAAKR